MRINKFLSDIGFCSRRQADKLIEEKRVYINNELATVGMRLSNGQAVKVDKKVIGKLEDIENKKLVLIAVNKPVGVVCSTTDNDKAINLVDFINYPTRIYPIGRLDKDSRGLILMTNQGKLVNEIMKASNYHEKEYFVKVDKKISLEFIKNMSEGVYLKELKVKTRKCRVEKINDYEFRIILTQGLNRQIRRMSKTLGYEVIELKRVRIMNIKLGKLMEGTYRNVSKSEYKELMESINER
mgnify:CR=1 FL=1|jgi:hypothetical protein